MKRRRASSRFEGNALAVARDDMESFQFDGPTLACGKVASLGAARQSTSVGKVRLKLTVIRALCSADPAQSTETCQYVSPELYGRLNRERQVPAMSSSAHSEAPSVGRRPHLHLVHNDTVRWPSTDKQASLHDITVRLSADPITPGEAPDTNESATAAGNSQGSGSPEGNSHGSGSPKVGTIPTEEQYVGPRFRVQLVYLGEDVEIDGLRLAKLAEKLNKCQSLFEFGRGDPVVDLGPYDKTHTYSYDKFYTWASHRKQGTNYHAAIGITHQALEDQSFNNHSIQERVGVVTLHDYEKYKPPSMRIDQYVTYLILCESLCHLVQEDLEHQATHYCLFDWCTEKDTMRKCLANPHVCVGSKDNLRQALGRKRYPNVEQALVEVDKALRYVSKKSIVAEVAKAWNNPVIGILLGGLAVNMLSSYLSDLAPWILWTARVVTIVLLVGLTIFIVHRNRRSHAAV
jgi:hypothetical protein